MSAVNEKMNPATGDGGAGAGRSLEAGDGRSVEDPQVCHQCGHCGNCCRAEGPVDQSGHIHVFDRNSAKFNLAFFFLMMGLVAISIAAVVGIFQLKNESAVHDLAPTTTTLPVLVARSADTGLDALTSSNNDGASGFLTTAETTTLFTTITNVNTLTLVTTMTEVLSTETVPTSTGSTIVTTETGLPEEATCGLASLTTITVFVSSIPQIITTVTANATLTSTVASVTSTTTITVTTYSGVRPYGSGSPYYYSANNTNLTLSAPSASFPSSVSTTASTGAVTGGGSAITTLPVTSDGNALTRQSHPTTTGHKSDGFSSGTGVVMLIATVAAGIILIL